MSDQLKPCPFCGGAAEKEVTICDRTVRCLNPACRATISTDTATAKRFDSVTRWNRRAP